jgi:hypothetical protein
MSGRSWCSHALFEHGVATAPLVDLCLGWIEEAGFQLEGYLLEPLDPKEWNVEESDEPIPVESPTELKAELLQHPGLGDIIARSPIHHRNYAAILTITLRDAFGHPETVDYLSFDIMQKEFDQLGLDQRKALIEFHVQLMGSIQSLVWMTLGQEKELFLTWIAGETDVSHWREGKGLVALDYTWIRKDFYSLARKYLPPGLPFWESDLPGAKEFFRLHEQGPL